MIGFKRLWTLICCGLMTLSSCSKKETLFTSLKATQTGVTFENKLPQKDLFGILYFLYYYNGGGVATGDINGDSLPDIYFTANTKGGNKLYLNKGAFQFEDITAKAGVAGTADWCSGATMADVNGDGLLDIYVSAVSGMRGLKGHNELFINKGGGRFEEQSKAYGLDFSGFTSQAAFFDYDRDGDLDCYLVNQSHHPHANIVDTSFRNRKDSLSGDRLYRNESRPPHPPRGDLANTQPLLIEGTDNNETSLKSGPAQPQPNPPSGGGRATFTDVTASAGIYQSNLGYGLGLAVADFNGDGWDDVYIGNDFHENDYYYINQQNGTFKESGAQHFRHYSRFSMGNDAADYNNDGQLDLVTVDMLPPDEKTLKTYGSDENPDIYNVKLLMNGYQYQYSRNVLQRNNGSGQSFSDVALLNGVSATDWSWAPLFADFDNDGLKDLFISSGIVKRPVDLDYIRFVSNLQARKGMDQTDRYDNAALEKMPDGASHPFLFRNNGEAFEAASEAWGTAGMKGYYTGASYADLDGDGALDVVINAIDAPAVILKNNTPQKTHLSVSFNGEGGNTSGIGAKAYVFAGGKMQYAQQMLTRGFQSSVAPGLHFGLGNAKKADSVIIVWPDQRYQVVKNIQPGKLSVAQGNASGTFNYDDFFKKEPELLQPADTLFSWRHRENPFIDVNIQYLIPHAQSSRGPKMAVADVNGDGLDDVYICGAKDQAGALFLARQSGGYAAGNNAAFEKDSDCEDVAALFADVNGDGHPDLIVASGGNEALQGDARLQDRIYLNDGKGVFAKGGNIPFLPNNKSCIAAADVDGDGDQDLFIGVLTNSLAYGVPQTSYLLLNDGKGSFTADKARIDLENIGTVTAAQFADVNGDGKRDLIVAGEWMPLTIYLNGDSKFEKTVVPASTGWWQTLRVEDVDGDGNVDILGGNWGLNNKFSSGKNGPVKLYVSDFDRNGSVDQLMSYTVNGKEYPFLAKDETERALPVLKKHYLLYAEYAGEEMKDAFYGFVDNMEPLQAEQLASVVCFGNGKGSFDLKPLPAALQVAPIFSFQKLTTKNGLATYMAGGNFFDVIPYEGRYDGQPLALFGVSRDKHLSYIHQPTLFNLRGQVRDIAWLHRGRDSVLTVVRNNEPVVFYKMP